MNAASYGITEAAGYLRIPASTLRVWTLSEEPLIPIADRKKRQLSFINLVEAFMFAGSDLSVLRDPEGMPEKIVLFPSVVIDPKFSFGRPILEGFGVRTGILAARFHAGDNVEDLAREYGAPPEAIENAIRCEAWYRSPKRRYQRPFLDHICQLRYRSSQTKTEVSDVEGDE